MLDVSSDVQDCTANLQTIYDGLREYQALHGTTPERAGVGFLAQLVTEGVLEAGEARRVLTCPGPGAAPVPAGTDWADPDTLDARSSSYAARDTLKHPLTKFPAGGPAVQALVACDNAQGSNHVGVLNVLYSDRTVRTFEIERLVSSGVLDEGATFVPVGPDSPIEALRTLVAD